MLAEANRQAEKIILEGMNHVLKDAPADRMANIKTYNEPDLPLKDGLMEKLIFFIREK